MDIYYAKEPLPKKVWRSIFLAGPTPRTKEDELPEETWRTKAITLLGVAKGFAFDGIVFSPEPASGKFRGSYEDQVAWEQAALEMADVILFWVPRDMDTLPALTTNVEFGQWVESGKVVFGGPPDDVAHRNRYLRKLAEKYKVPSCTTLEDTVAEALKRIPVQAYREGGEVQVPFHIWQMEGFQAWYRALKVAGNRLDGAKVKWTFFSTKTVPVRPIFWALHVDVHVTSENRNKTNEILFSRADLSSVVLFRPAPDVWDTEIALVREFRSPVRNALGYVLEAPGGSSFKPGHNPYQDAVDEVQEEMGLILDADRVYALEDRQLMSTMSTHKNHLFAVELTGEEIQQLRDVKGTTFGNEADTERTFVEVLTLREVLASKAVDWSMLGMILRTVFVQKLSNLASPPVDFLEKAKQGYNAYGKTTEWKNYAGLPMPTWDELPERIRFAWVEATKGILSESLQRR